MYNTTARFTQIRGNELVMSDAVSTSDERVWDSFSDFPQVQLRKVCLATFPQTGRGIKCTKSISANETLISIPSHYLLNIRTISPFLGFDWKHPPLDSHAAVSLFILIKKRVIARCRRRNEKVSPNDVVLEAYLESLPDAATFYNIPLTYGNKFPSETTNLVHLLPSSTQHYLARQQILFDKHYMQAQNYLHSTLLAHLGNLLHNTQTTDKTREEVLTRDDFLYAWLCVNSRCIYQELMVPSRVWKKEWNLTCCPLVDMFNHVPTALNKSMSSNPHSGGHPSKEGCKFVHSKRGLEVVSQSSIERGEEIFISYGAHSNEALLCEYGFMFSLPTSSISTDGYTVITNPNPDTYLDLTEVLMQRCGRSELAFLQDIGYSPSTSEGAAYTISCMGEIDFRCQVVLRVLLLSTCQAEEKQNSERRLKQFISGISNGEREMVALHRYLSEVLKGEMSQISKTLDHLRSLHADGVAGQRLECIRMLWEERLTLCSIALSKLAKSC